MNISPRIEFEEILVYGENKGEKCFLWAVESKTKEHHKLEEDIIVAYSTNPREVFFNSNLKKFVFSLIAKTDDEAEIYRNAISELIILCSGFNAFGKDISKENPKTLSSLISVVHV
ncbi:TPA: hypothetical protein ACGG8A_002031 [Vibrio cholerae]